MMHRHARVAGGLTADPDLARAGFCFREEGEGKWIEALGGGRPRLFFVIKWLVMMALLAGCATQQKAQSDCKMEWTGRTPVQVDSCTGRREDLTAGWHWYDYVFGIPLGMLGFYDPGRTAD